MQQDLPGILLEEDVEQRPLAEQPEDTVRLAQQRGPPLLDRSAVEGAGEEREVALGQVLEVQDAAHLDARMLACPDECDAGVGQASCWLR